MCTIETQVWQWKPVLCESFSTVHVHVFHCHTSVSVQYMYMFFIAIPLFHCHTSVSMLYMCFNAIYVFQLETHTWHWHTCMAFKHFVCYWKHTLCSGKYVQHWNTCIEICAQHWNTKMVLKHMYGTYWRSVRQGWWTGPLKWQNNCVFNDKNVCHWRGGRWEFVPDFPDIKQIHRFHHFIVHNISWTKQEVFSESWQKSFSKSLSL